MQVPNGFTYVRTYEIEFVDDHVPNELLAAIKGRLPDSEAYVQAELKRLLRQLASGMADLYDAGIKPEFFLVWKNQARLEWETELYIDRATDHVVYGPVWMSVKASGKVQN